MPLRPVARLADGWAPAAATVPPALPGVAAELAAKPDVATAVAGGVVAGTGSSGGDTEAVAARGIRVAAGVLPGASSVGLLSAAFLCSS